MGKKKNNVVIRAVLLMLAIALLAVGIVFCVKTFNTKGENNEPALTTTVSTTFDTTETTLTTNSESAAELSTESTTLTSETTSTEESKLTESELTTSIDEAEFINTTNTSNTDISNVSTTVEAVVEIESCAAAPTLQINNVKKSIEEIAKEVWQGKWGCGADRKARLTKAGYNYKEVQKKVNGIGKDKVIPTSEKATPIATPNKNGLTLVKTFTRGTYYAYGCAKKGGSGRQLISCSSGGQGVKGSIASWYLYKNYGYKRNGRTKVYLEISGYSSMNGWYYLDDSCAPGYNNVIDFFYINGRSCPFSKQGVVSVKCYI